jgi:hypothetical protein
MSPNGNQLEPMITLGFLLAAAWNVLGMLTFSKFFTNQLLASLDPAVFSWLGQIAVVLWGLAYLSVAKAYPYVPWLLVVFFVEKMIYGGRWLVWLIANGRTLPKIAHESFLTATFYAIYGAGDLAFGCLFGWLALRALTAQ